jgi:hypothetical protein
MAKTLTRRSRNQKGGAKTAFRLQNGVVEARTLKENTMKALSRFVIKFTNLIVAVLSCFDRVIFKGYPSIRSGGGPT